jgi:hypothetical protein
MEKYLFFLFFTPLSILAQKNAQFTMTVSGDTVGMNGNVEVVFTLENAQGRRFNFPKFKGFVAQGPSTSMMTSITNGEMKQTQSYTFYLTPQELGAIEIGEATVEVNGETLKTEPKSIVVVEKYEAEIKPRQQAQSFWGDDDFFFRRPTQPQQPPKPQQVPEKKRKYQTEKL